MSTSGNMRQTRSRTAGSVTPSVAGSNAGSDTSSQRAPSQAGSRTGDRRTRGSRTFDTYGSKASDRAAAQLRRQAALQNVSSAFGASLDQGAQPAMFSREPTPNDQFQQVEASEIMDNSGYAHDVTGHDLPPRDLDGATARHTPADNFARIPRQNLRYVAASSAQADFNFGNVAKKWLSYLFLILFILACLIAFGYSSFLLFKLDRFTTTGRQYQALAKGLESINQDAARLDEGVRQQFERQDHRMVSLEEKLLNLHDQKEFAIYGGKPAVDWFHASNMAVTISKYTSPEKMRKVGGFLGLFQKKVAFNAAPYIVGPFAGVEKMWCAPSDHGKAQITVLLAKKIIPQVLIVEQSDTKDTTPFWQTFPDQIEFWASFDENGPEPIINHFPTLVPGEKSQGRKLTDVQALPESFKMLGRWNYDLHSRRRKQIFRIIVNQPTNLVSFRVNTNHGDADQMCLHKLRLYGTPSEPERAHGTKIYKEDRAYMAE